MGIDVRGMNFLESVLIVRGGPESSAIIDDFVVENNDLSGVDSHLWTGIRVEEMGQAALSNVTFCNNAVIDHVATASEGSTFTLETAELCELATASASVSH